MLAIRRFAVEHLTKGCVTDCPHPKFSYSVESDRQNVVLQKAVITVGEWRVETASQTGTPYEGPDLQPFTRYQASLSVTDDAGETASATVEFETGRFGEQWKADWITDASYRFKEKKLSPKPMTFRKKFTCAGAVKSARLYVTALGIYELMLNGRKVGDDYFAPGFTSYRHQIQYQTYDITGQLAETISQKAELTSVVTEPVGHGGEVAGHGMELTGQDAELTVQGAKLTAQGAELTAQEEELTAHAADIPGRTQKPGGRQSRQMELTAVVAGGWAVGSFTYKRRNRVYAKRQALLCELRIEYEDGTWEIIGTDESWQVTEDGNFREAEFYNGEVYDAAVDLENAPWKNASRETLTIHPEILAWYGAPVKAHERLKPVTSFRAKSGMIIYDFGQNFAGVIHAELEGKQGQKVVFRHAEILMDNELYTEPLRTARQEAVYYCRDGHQTYSPRMTYMGFRYVGVTGIQESDLELSAFALYSDVEDNGSFSCSDPLVNRLQENIRWGAKSNFVDIPTDCPQRDERMGWTGDIALFASTAAFNFNISRFLEKWLRDVKAEQNRGGGIPVTVPLVRVPFQWEIMIPMAVDHWGDVCILAPWAEYRARGDEGILREMYPVMKRYIKACKFWAQLFSVGKRRRIWRLLHHYGDWCAPGIGLWAWMGRGKWTATACMAYSSNLLSQIAEILGEQEDAAYYRNLSRETSQAYRDLLMGEDCKVKKEFQTAYVLPLYYQMLSEEDRKKTAANLVNLIRNNDYHIATGFPGTPYVLFALADNGYEEDAYRMLLTDTCPSWLYEVKVGGTTTWERWDALREDGTCNTGKDDGTGGMVSFNHYAAGAVGDFLYRRVAGIEPLEGGYGRFRVQPLTGGPITWAEAEVETAYGKVSSRWKQENGQFTIQVEVPVGTVCQLVMPDKTTHHLGSGKYTLTARSAARP